MTEGKGEEREEIESKRGVKSNAYGHNEADRYLSGTNLRPGIGLVEMECDINDTRFARACAEALLKNMTRRA